MRMPGKVKVRVVAGRGLPVMDRSADTTDAFAEVCILILSIIFTVAHIGEAGRHNLQDRSLS